MVYDAGRCVLVLACVGLRCPQCAAGDARHRTGMNLNEWHYHYHCRINRVRVSMSMCPIIYVGQRSHL